MTDSGRWRLWVGRGGAEVAIVIVGVVMGLAVDRWFAGIDERVRADTLSLQLEEDLVADSLAVVAAVELFRGLSEFGMETLRLVEDPAGRVADPTEFVLTMERMGWWVPFGASRATWDEIINTGQLGLFGRDSRSALTGYYAWLELFKGIEARWEPVFAEFWLQEQAAVPPLLRIGVLDPAFGMDAAREVTQAEADAILAGLRADPAWLGAFGMVTTISRYGAAQLGQLIPIMAETRATLRAR